MAVIKVNVGFKVDKVDVMKKVPLFVKCMRDYFFEVKTKGNEGGRVYTKCLILYNIDFADLVEMLKEEFSEKKLFIKP